MMGRGGGGGGVDALGGGVHGAELGDEVRGVFCGVYGEGARDYEEGLGEFADGELFARALWALLACVVIRDWAILVEKGERATGR